VNLVSNEPASDFSDRTNAVVAVSECKWMHLIGTHFRLQRRKKILKIRKL